MILDLLIGNILCATGAILGAVEVYRRREVLKGFSLLSTVLTVIALFELTRGFFALGEYLSVGFSLITFGYWLIITIALIISKIRKRSKR